MTSLDSASTSGLPRSQRQAQLAELLTCGGDERIVLDAALGCNRYGCGTSPDSETLAFSSSTASTISAPAFAAAGERLERILAARSPREAYRAGAAEVRRRLAALCGLPAAAAEDVVLAASGTDLHLIAADLARGAARQPVVTVLADPRESGRGVPNAVRGRRYSATSPHGPACRDGEVLAGAPAGELVSVALREPDGAPRPAELVDAEFEQACAAAVRAGGPVLLILLDVSKTGLVAPSPACGAALKRRYGEAVTVLVDACQFRLSAAALAGYLQLGFLVAVTGSKFLGGPAFSGALFLPQADAGRLRRASLSPGLGDYSARDDWPAGYVGRAVLPDLQNLGLLLRWEAALHELEAFRAVPDASVRRLVETFGEAVSLRLSDPAAFEPLTPPPVQRRAAGAWDALPTIFPFFVRQDGMRMAAAATQDLYQRLRGGLGSHPRVLLGQPVAVAEGAGEAFAALRLSLSARQIVTAEASATGTARLIEQAMRALDAVAQARLS